MFWEQTEAVIMISEDFITMIQPEGDGFGPGEILGMFWRWTWVYLLMEKKNRNKHLNDRMAIRNTKIKWSNEWINK